VRGEGSGGRRRHLSSTTRAALAHTRLVEVVPAGPSRLHSSAPPGFDEPPVVLHPLWAPVHPRRPDGTDARSPIRRSHGLHPAVAPRRGPRPGRRPRPVVPFDIPIEAFAVEVGGSSHPSVRSLGDRRLVYVEHRLALRRSYRRRQLFLAVGLSGAFVAVAAVALAPRGADAVVPPASVSAEAQAVTAPVSARSRGASARRISRRPISVRPTSVRPTSVRPTEGSRRRPVLVAARPAPRPDDRDETSVGPPYVPGWHGQPLANDPFLVCTRQYESVNAGGYTAVSRGGQYWGAYQFDRRTWNNVARYLGRFELVGVDPAAAPAWVQDLMAYSLYQWKGAVHWDYRCAGLP
jgi:hypothetical protein